MNENPKVLLISHNFPPTAGPESNLVRLNAEFLHRQGMRVRVLTTTETHSTQGMDASLLLGLSREIMVDRVASPEAVLSERFPRLGRLAAVGAGRFIFPEIYFPWMIPATKRARKIVRDWKPDVLYSRATKHVSNVVGWHLKRATGLPWIAHFSDPWISAGLPYRPIQRLIGHHYERRILRDADVLVFVSCQAAERVLRSYPQHWHERVKIIPHGFEPLNFELSHIRPPDPRGRPLRLIHAGAFYPTMRTPVTLIEALRRLRKRQALAGRLEIHCVGVDTTCYQAQVDAAGVQEVLHLRQGVPFDECQRLVAASDMTLIIDSPGYGGVFLPTKLVEAFAFDRPVLGLSEKSGAVAEVLQQTQLHWADLNDPESIANQLEALLKKWESGEWGLTAVQRKMMDRFQIDSVNQPLVEIFGSLSGQSSVV